MRHNGKIELKFLPILQPLVSSSSPSRDRDLSGSFLGSGSSVGKLSMSFCLVERMSGLQKGAWDLELDLLGLQTPCPEDSTPSEERPWP